MTHVSILDVRHPQTQAVIFAILNEAKDQQVTSLFFLSFPSVKSAVSYALLFIASRLSRPYPLKSAYARVDHIHAPNRGDAACIDDVAKQGMP